jgi:N-acetylmuramoyl-L-alanine amidase
VSPSSGNVKKTYGLIFLMTALLLWAGAGSAWAFDVCVNGTPVELSVRPALRGVKVMLPLKCLAQPLGLEVAYEALGGPVVVSGGDREAVVVADTCEVKADGKTFDLGVAPYWDKEEIMVPMQFFIDAFGFSANFDPLSATMWIQSGGYKPIPLHTAEVLGGGRQEEAPEEEAAAGMESVSSLSNGQLVEEVESEEVAAHGGLQILAISQFLQEIREQTAVLAGTEVPGGGERTRLVGVLPCIEEGRQRLDFITSGEVKVQPMLLTEPARLVLDVEGAVVDALDDELYIDKGVIHRVRLSQYQEGTARAVVDLAEATGYQLKEMPDGKGFSVVFNQRIGRINLLRSDEQIRLNLEVSGPVRYSVKRLASPNRIVIDLEGATFVAGATEANVYDSAIEKLRISQFTPTTARLVMDLTHSLEIVDIDAGDNEREIDLVFLDPSWGRYTQGRSIGGDLTEAFRQGVEPRLVVGLKRLAALGRNLVNLIPSGEALAMEQEPLDESHGLAGDDGNAPSALEAADGDDMAHDGLGSGSSQGSADGAAGDKPLAAEQVLPELADEAGLGQCEDLAAIGDDTLILTIGSGYRQIDFSRWPKLQVDWITDDALAALKGRSVLIDAGHGGAQPGAPGVGGVWEKVYNLAVALRVGELLSWAGARVSYTRVGDQTVSLRERVDKAYAVDAEILVSIHANASLTRDATGTETLYHPAISESRMLAEAIQTELVEQLGLLDRGIKERSDLYILRHSPVPSALVEVGFLDHLEEGAFLLTGKAIDQACMGLVRGIAAFFQSRPDRETPSAEEGVLPQLRIIPDVAAGEPDQDSGEPTPLEEEIWESPVEVDEEPLLGGPAGSDTVEDAL